MRGRRQYARKGRRHGKGAIWLLSLGLPMFASAMPLDQAVRAGLAIHPEVRSAMAEADRAGTEVEMAKGGYYPSVTMSGAAGVRLRRDRLRSHRVADAVRLGSGDEQGRQRQRDPAQAVRGGAGGARRCGAGYRRDLPRRACLGAPGGGGARTHPAPRRHPRDDPGARRRRLRRPQRAGSRQSGTVAGPGAVVAGEGQPAGRAQPVRDPGRPGTRRPRWSPSRCRCNATWRPAIWRG